MRQSFVLANILARPARTIASIFGVALGVVLILVTVGLARGILYETGQREKNVGAEIIFQSAGTLGASITATPLALPVAYTQRLREIEGVRAVTPLGRYIRSGAGGIGFEMIEGIVDRPTDTYTTYAAISGIRIVEGHPLQSDDEIIVDRHYATTKKIAPGSRVEILNHTFTVAGIYEPESGGRVKMRLSKMQELLGAPGKCSSILVKCVDPAEQERVAERIEAALPGNQIIFTRDIPSYYDRGIPALNTFLRVVVGLALVISSLVILLAMYTSITERTREIGILKSLGASRGFIIAAIEKEALTISALGVTLGYLASFIAKAGIMRYTSLIVKFEGKWLLTAALVGLLAGALGALYPAVHAARQDPVRALAYE
jgi:putative ABC transport system permease protein